MSRRAISGFTLTELVVAMGVGLFVTALSSGFVNRLLRTETSLLGELSLVVDLANLAAVMRADIERADPGGVVRPRRDCLLFRYRSPSGTYEAGGFRLDGGRLQRRTSGGCPPAGCRSCAGGRWTSLTDGGDWRVVVLDFRVEGRGSGPAIVEVVLAARRRYPPRVERRFVSRILVRG